MITRRERKKKKRENDWPEGIFFFFLPFSVYRVGCRPVQHLRYKRPGVVLVEGREKERKKKEGNERRRRRRKNHLSRFFLLLRLAFRLDKTRQGKYLYSVSDGANFPTVTSSTPFSLVRPVTKRK